MTRKLVLLSLFFIAGFDAPAFAQSPVVEDAYVRGLIPGRDVTAAFMSIDNTTGSDCLLTGAESSLARSVEIHSHSHHHGMMQMRRLESVPIAAGERVVFEPGGLHLMLFGVAGPLSPDREYPLVLSFEGCEDQTVSLSVRELM